MRFPDPPLSVALVGAGRVGTAVAHLLGDAGHNLLGVASRSATSAERAAAYLAAPVLALAADDWSSADLVLIGASDDAIAPVADGLAPLLRPGAVVWHLAGSLGTAPLATVADAGMSVAATHPVAACPDVESAVRNLPGSAWGVTAAHDVARWSTELIEGSLGGMAVAVPEDARTVWHSAAVVTSNGIAALLAVGEALLAAIGIEDGNSVLGPLAAGTLANARAGGGGASTMTGPVVRGESGVVARHLTALRAHHPELAGEYARVQLGVLERAVASGRLDEERAGALRAILGAAT